MEASGRRYGVAVSAHDIDDTAGSDHRLAGSLLGRSTMRGTAGQRGYAGNEGPILVAPFHYDTISKRLRHQITPSLNRQKGGRLDQARGMSSRLRARDKTV